MSGMSAPITIRLISCFVVFPIIHPTRECVSQSGMFVPPFESPGGCVESPGSEKEVEGEGDRGEASEVDEGVFPWFVTPKFGGSEGVVPGMYGDDVDEISFLEVLVVKVFDVDMYLWVGVWFFLDEGS